MMLVSCPCSTSKPPHRSRQGGEHELKELPISQQEMIRMQSLDSHLGCSCHGLKFKALQSSDSRHGRWTCAECWLLSDRSREIRALVTFR